MLLLLYHLAKFTHKTNTCCYYLLYHLAKFIPPKWRFWKEEQKMKSGYRRKHFSRVWVLDLGHEPWKSQSKIRISSFVNPSKIFVWGSINLLQKDSISRTNVSCELDRRIVVLSSSSESKKLHAPQTKNFTHPKRRFWKDEQQMKCRFSKHFSRVRVLHMGH
jgi:hypothetical protein